MQKKIMNTGNSSEYFIGKLASPIRRHMPVLLPEEIFITIPFSALWNVLFVIYIG